MTIHPSTVTGFENANGQRNLGALGIAGTDYNQLLYHMKCGHCGEEYAANGTDIHHRKCPQCQGGAPSSGGWMPDRSVLEVFPAPTDTPFVIEHVSDEFTSLCPKTGHPDFGTVTLRYQPRAAKDGGVCVELKSLKLYYQAFRTKGIFYEAVTNQIKDDLVKVTAPLWLIVKTEWRGRGGIRSVIRSTQGDVPEVWLR